jgi:group I intron endonuclease
MNQILYNKTMTYGIIYCYLFPNGKRYIGLTIRDKKRKKEHMYNTNNPLKTNRVYNAFRKYGFENTKYEVLDIAESSTELCEKERMYIQMYNSYIDGNGYNMTYGGEGTFGYKFTEEQKRTNSERGKVRFKNSEEIQKQSERITQFYIDNPNAGKEHGDRLKQLHKDNPEIGKLMSDKKKQYHIENPNAGTEHGIKMQQLYNDNPEKRELMSDKKKQYYIDNPEAGKDYGIKMRQLHKDNPEIGKLMSDKKKQFHIDNPNAGKEHGDRLKQLHKDNPEIGKLISDKKKQYYIENPNAKRKGLPKSFDVCKIDGTYIGTFDYQFEARTELNLKYEIPTTVKISEVLRGTRPSSHGLLFTYNL